MKQQRLVGLDLIRGLCALAVMVYHYSHAAGWDDLTAMGTYGVYIFFVLSGFALFYVYSERPLDERFLREFYISRCLRIFPLFFAVAVYRSWGAELDPYTAIRMIVHATPLAGIAHPPAFSSVVIGGWSILIEWSFYLLFPLLLLFRGTKALVALFIFALIVNHLYVLAAYYPPDGIRPGRELRAQDTMTFLAYFVGGMFAAHIWLTKPALMENLRRVPIPLALSVALMAGIFALPHLVEFNSRRAFLSGWTSTYLILASCVLVFLASLREPTGVLKKVSAFLGDISLALYLLHMYVWHWVGSFVVNDMVTQFILSAAVSIPVSWVVFIGYEKPIRDIRKNKNGPKGGHA